ncbi:OLC1v1006680C1 [Oldenlandia corymbosa var. corymbosa]|uniref:OLC1v1006680C1 n=1 Tax=Oldenlandia corymbosa var. corymbosa TaxID=529605 RepID=A0AAV1DK75_OLDCO|nr:OLC1v1006680C1 [Oldenlandia corymbosa var. corymbosa]
MRLTPRNPFFSILRSTFSSASIRPISTAAPEPSKPLNPSPPIPQANPYAKPDPYPRIRTKTPLEREFETWIHKLKPGFTPPDVREALTAQSDPDLALDIFRWTAQQRGYKHDHLNYLCMIEISVTRKRYRVAETLIEEVLAGACPPSLALYNSMIKFCCDRKYLFKRAFDIYKKMLKFDDVSLRPSLETYTMLLISLLRKFDKAPVCYVYMHSVRSLAKQMKASGVIPDTLVLNLILKAYSKCLEVDEAIRIFREMGLYGCEPNAYTYSYLVKGLCEKVRVNQGLEFFKEMRRKNLVPKAGTYVILICSLAMERRFDDAIQIVFDMLGNTMFPDFLTYKCLLEELCRDGRGDDASELLERLRKKDHRMNEKIYCALLNVLHDLN